MGSSGIYHMEDRCSYLWTAGIILEGKVEGKTIQMDSNTLLDTVLIAMDHSLKNQKVLLSLKSFHLVQTDPDLGHLESLCIHSPHYKFLLEHPIQLSSTYQGCTANTG